MQKSFRVSRLKNFLGNFRIGLKRLFEFIVNEVRERVYLSFLRNNYCFWEDIFNFTEINFKCVFLVIEDRKG